MLVLNIAGGKFPPRLTKFDNTKPTYTVNVDTSYYSEVSPAFLEKDITHWLNSNNKKNERIFINKDIFEFIERTILHFDRVTIYRFLEHVSFTQVDYFIYLVSTITNPGGIVDIIVPNYKILAQMILDEEKQIAMGKFRNYNDFTAWNIELTTELLNEPSCPHASIWTPYRAKKFWEREKRFTVDIEQVKEQFTFDGRNIYMRFYAQRTNY